MIRGRISMKKSPQGPSNSVGEHNEGGHLGGNNAITTIYRGIKGKVQLSVLLGSAQRKGFWKVAIAFHIIVYFREAIK